MKKILYPACIPSTPVKSFSKLPYCYFLCFLLITFLLSFSSTAMAKTVVIGTGSGSVSQTSMSGLNPGDVLAIAPGSYSSATFANLNNITIINNGGVVAFTGEMALGSGLSYVTISGTGAAGVTYGFQFSGISSDGIDLQGTNTVGLRIYNCSFNNVSGNCIDASGYYTTYNGDTSTFKLYKTAIANISLNNSGLLLQGSWGVPTDFNDIIDSLAIWNVVCTQTASNGQEIAIIAYQINIHDWNITYNGANPVAGDCGEFVIYGNGTLRNVYSHGGRGYLARWWNVGLNGTGNSYVYNNIDLATNAYGFIDTRNDPTMFSGGTTVPYTTGGNMNIWNNNSGNKVDINGYIAPLAVIGAFAGYNCEVKNNIGFNTVNGTGSLGIIQDNSGGSWVPDSSNNRYYPSTQIMSVMTDTVNCYLKAGVTGAVIDQGTNAGQIANYVTYDIAYVPRPQGTSWDIGAREYSTSSSFVTANAGSAQTITLPTNTVSLSGSGSTVVNSTISSYLWSEVSGPNQANLSAPSSVITSATGLVSGTYVFGLKVKDANNDSSSATVSITVNSANLPPVVNAGSNQTITLPTSTATLSGSATDATGTITNYLWTELSGPNTATIAANSSASTSVSGLAAGTYIFQLKVTDNNNLSDAATVTITVNPASQPPVVNAGTSQSITLPTSSVTLNGSATDASGTITTYAWTELSGPGTATITNASSASTTITGLAAGTYVFELTVTDNNSLSGSATVTITVNADPTAPVVNAGSSQTITLPTSSAALSGSATDANGTISTYAWTEVSGPNTATISSASSSNTSISSLEAGNYSFQLKVTNNAGQSGTATVTVTVNPATVAPVVDAGTDQTITLPTSTVTLSGSATDAVGTIAAYYWSEISGPGEASLSSVSSASTSAIGLIAGTYVFQLKVTNNAGQSGTATVNITVNAANVAPVVNAGSSQSITMPASSVNLTGSATDANGTISSYSWTESSGPNAATISNASSASTSVSGLEAGTYVFQIKDTNNAGQSGTATVNITVNEANVAPVVNAGSRQSITMPASSVNLSGSATDANGTISSYSWTESSGPNKATISNGSSASTLVSGLEAGTYVFQLKATNDAGQSGTSSVTITVNLEPVAPIVNAGSDQTITLPTNTGALSGSATDAVGTITAYSWSELSGPNMATISNASSASTSISGLVPGTYIFQLNVTNNTGLSGTATVMVNVNPAPVAPVVNAGSNQTITLPVNSTSLIGSATDSIGAVISYQWTEISGPNTATLTTPGTPSTSATGLIEGTYTFQLKATNNSGQSGDASVTITVNSVPHSPPVANAGADQTITLPTNNVVVDGSASRDADGTIVSFLWTEVSGPSQVTIVNPSSVTTTITNLVAGTYIIKLTVTDNDGASSSDEMNITVNPEPIQPPKAYAGSSITITLPLDSASLNGTKSSDQNGTIVNYAWTEVSGPSSATINSPTSSITEVSQLVAGKYVFKLTVTNNAGQTNSDQVDITVNSASNVNPIANAGASQTITLPLDSASVDGSASIAPGGSIVSYLWSQVSGPQAATIENPSSVSTNITNLVQGIYIIQLTITDNNGLKASDSLAITVNPAPHIPPVANAGSSVTINLPDDSTTLSGSGSTDADGTIISYNWIQVSGPSTATIEDASSESTDVSGMVAGQYVFQLTVTDNSAATSTAKVKVNVTAAPAQVPVANAGSNQTITLPTDSVTLNGSQSTSTNGNIKSYAWDQLSGPLTAQISNANAVSTDVTGLDSSGTYVFKLTVIDSLGLSASAQVTITVNPAPVVNMPPVAIAGNDTTIAMPANSMELNGSHSYTKRGSLTGYSWEQVSGPNTASLSQPDDSVSKANSLTAGTYIFKLTVTNSEGLSASDTVSVSVVDNGRTSGTQAMTLYPNPTSSNITVQITSQTIGNLLVYIYDISGNLAMVKHFSKPDALFSQQINTSSLINGTYSLKATINNQTVMIGKFIKQ